MPDHWYIRLIDVVGKTLAIEQGQYKAVNMAGAAAISVETRSVSLFQENIATWR